MKFLSATVASLIFFLIIVARPAYAQVTEIPIPTDLITPTSSPTATVNYDLPYPGILPGNPLYPLKALRDKILELIISDPVKKADFYLLQADKRLASSILLFDKGDPVNGETTLSKSQTYLEKSLDKAIEAKKSQKNLGDLIPRIQNSSANQKLQIFALTKKSKGDTQQRLKGDYQRAVEFQKRADAIKPQ